LRGAKTVEESIEETWINVFFGESMFSTMTDASKVALVALCSHLQAKGFSVIDCQVASQHLFSLGAKEIPRNDFLGYLHEIDIQKKSFDFGQNFELV